MCSRVLCALAASVSTLLAGCANDDAASDEIEQNQGAGSGGTSGQPSTCDPFLAAALSLGTIVGAGKDANGTLYVVDSPPGFRVFVSEGDDLVRQYVSGFGSEGENDFIFDILEHDPAFTLKLETAGSTRMGVLFGTPPDKMFQVGELGEELVLVSDAEVQSKQVKNGPSEIQLFYSGTLADGRWVVVTLPKNYTSGDDHRLFFGESTHLYERVITKITQGLSLWAPRMFEFELDGQLTTLVVAITPPSSPPQASTLSSMPLTDAPPPSDASYLCMSQ